MNTHSEKYRIFKSLHDSDQAFLLPNPWDTGTAKILASMGFPALATTSLGVAISAGRKAVRRADVLRNVKEICDATELPVNADLENGFADEPMAAAEIIREAHACGAVGASLEDFTGNPDKPIYEFSQALERVCAGVEMSASLPGGMVFTARAENLLWGIDDLDDTIRRLQAFADAGADVLYAPGLRTLDQMQAVVSSVSKPVNVVMGFADPDITLVQLQEIGVRRVSIGGAFARYAIGGFLEAAQQMSSGKFEFVRDIPPLSKLHALFDE